MPAISFMGYLALCGFIINAIVIFSLVVGIIGYVGDRKAQKKIRQERKECITAFFFRKAIKPPYVEAN